MPRDPCSLCWVVDCWTEGLVLEMLRYESTFKNGEAYQLLSLAIAGQLLVDLLTIPVLLVLYEEVVLDAASMAVTKKKFECAGNLPT